MIRSLRVEVGDCVAIADGEHVHLDAEVVDVAPDGRFVYAAADGVSRLAFAGDVVAYRSSGARPWRGDLGSFMPKLSRRGRTILHRLVGGKAEGKPNDHVSTPGGER